MARKEEEMFMERVFNRDYNGVLSFIRSGVNINCAFPAYGTPLHLAVAADDLRIAKLLLDYGADCNRKHFRSHIVMGVHLVEGFTDESPIRLAARLNRPEMVKLLIKYGANVNLRHRNGESALYTALNSNNQTCAQILIQNGAEVLSVDVITAARHCPGFDISKLQRECGKFVKNMHALHAAVFDEDVKSLRCLFKKGVNINVLDNYGKTALHIALEKGFIGNAELLIQKGVDVNAQDMLKITALHIAASQGITKIIPLLIENGALVNAKGYCDLTPLHFAVSNSHPMCVKQLLNSGASVNAKYQHNETALHLAIIKSPVCIELLMNENADIFATNDMGISPLDVAIQCGMSSFRYIFPGNYNVIGPDGLTPVHLAARSSKLECLQFLINDGCDVNVTNHNGDTPLHFACTGNVLNTKFAISMEFFMAKNVELLIRAGAEVDKKNNNGLSPVYLSVINNFKMHLELLHNHGADIDSPAGNKNQTPLHYAAEAGSLDCVEYLIENGASKNFVNSKNDTALMLAAKHSRFDCVKFLLEKDTPLWALESG